MSGSIFEEVGEAEAGGRGAPDAPGGAEQRRDRDRSRVRLWLFAVAALVVVQIVVGGLTRLTDSGLSIVEWAPVSGALPPLSDAAWAAEFDKYRTTTEYQEQNRGMSLAEFQYIYWWEWGHRQWGRLIGLAFFIPFVFFLATKAMPTGWTGRIAFIGALGALQGVIGWWMVSSGLVGRLDVSQYRLALHLGLAFVIFGLLIWAAFSLGRPDWALLQARRRREPQVRLAAYGLLGVSFVQIVMGAFVAGMDGGQLYNEWPSMGGEFYPSGEPFAPFDEPAAAQFVHRMLGYVVLAAALYFFWLTRGSGAGKTKLWGAVALGVVGVQVVIGVATLVHAAPLSWSAVHQFTGVLMFGALVHAAHQTAFPKEESLRT